MWKSAPNAIRSIPDSRRLHRPVDGLRNSIVSMACPTTDPLSHTAGAWLKPFNSRSKDQKRRVRRLGLENLSLFAF